MKHENRLKTLCRSLGIASFIFLPVSSLLADITIQNTDTSFETGDLTDANPSSNCTVTTANKLVVTANWEGAAIQSITYGLQAFKMAATSSSGVQRATSIWYLDDSAAGTNTIKVTFAANLAKGSLAGVITETGTNNFFRIDTAP